LSKGLDIGTSFVIGAANGEDNSVQYTEVRDAFFRMKASSPVALSMMEKGLRGQSYFKDSDGSFIVIGQDAIERAIERHMSASRPMSKGIISPKERDARRILKFILSEVVGKPSVDNEKLIFSIPAQPIDQPADEFDTGFHEDALRNDLREIGYDAHPINEAEAICYSELEKDNYTGLICGFGAGMMNACVMSSGEAIVKLATSRSGDFIDRMSAVSTGQPDSVVQVEKENGIFTIGQEVPGNPILSAVSAYYVRLIDYTVRCLSDALSKSSTLPKFTAPIPIVIAGGTSRANGFLDCFRTSLLKESLPFDIKEVRHAIDPLRSVARGCLIASSL